MVAAFRSGTTAPSIHLLNGSMAIITWRDPSDLEGCMGPMASRHHPRNGV